MKLLAFLPVTTVSLLCGGVLLVAWDHKESMLHRVTRPNIFPVESAIKYSYPIVTSDSRDIVVQALDYMCPPCHAQEPLNAAFRKLHPDAQWRVLSYPLDFHKGADKLAQMVLDKKTLAERAALHARFMATKDAVKFAKDVQMRPEMSRYLLVSKASPVTGTPTYFCYRRDGASMVCPNVTSVEEFLYGSSKLGKDQAPTEGCKADADCD